METITETTNRTEQVKAMALGHLWELCYRAHSNTSFSPEKRANSYVSEYSEMLEADLNALGTKQGNYKEKFTAKFGDWMSAKGRCMSSMITGGSNFPVRRAQKANDSERNKCDSFYHWRDKYFTAVNRVPTKSPEDDKEAAERKLEKLVNNQLEWKAINAAIRKSKLTDEKELLNHLIIQDFSPNTLKLIDYRGGKFVIPSFYLTNNNATIKNTKDKIKAMETRIDRKMTWEDITFEGGYVTIEDDRLKIFHDEKPSRETIQEIKSNGYRWSPNWVCWCRKHTGNAVHGLKYLSFLK